MTDDAKTTPVLIPQMTKPDPSLKRFEVLIGTWEMTGHVLGSSEQNIKGWNTFEWMQGGFFLKSFGTMSFMGSTSHSLEIISYDPVTGTFPSNVYSSMSGTVLPYWWDVQGNIVTHWEGTSKYIGTLSDDGNTLTGGWRPNEGETETPGNAYDVVMIRVKK